MLYCKAETSERRLSRLETPGVFAGVRVPYDRGGQIVVRESPEALRES